MPSALLGFDSLAGELGPDLTVAVGGKGQSNFTDVLSDGLLLRLRARLRGEGVLSGLGLPSSAAVGALVLA